MQSVVKMGRGGWQDAEVVTLREAVTAAGGRGEPLRGVFERIGQELGRKPNSVRNYYYASLKREAADLVPHAEPFELFSPDEVRKLVRGVLSARAKGTSVRACVSAMADGDRRLMLRYQNKYRSVLKTRPGLVREVMEEMRAAGEDAFDPYEARGEKPAALYAQVTGTLRASGDPALHALLRGLEALLARAGATEPRENALETACAPLLQCIKEYLGQPADARRGRLDAFCEALTERIGEVENALG